MTKGTQNQPSSDVEKVKSNEKPKLTLIELLWEVTESSVFSELHNEADLIAKIKNNPKEITWEIRAEMRRRLLENPSDYTDISGDDIMSEAKISDSLILEKMNLLLVWTKTGQEKLEKRIKSLFSDTTFDDTPNGRRNLRDLESWVQNQNINNINRYLKYPYQLRKQLRKDECFWNRVNYFVTRDTINFLRNLSIAESDLTIDEKEACAHISQGRGSVSENHIRIYLKIIEKSRQEETIKTSVKKDILREFFPTITPKLLQDLGVITEAEGREKVKEWLKSIFWADYFDAGTDEELSERKRFLEHAYRQWTYISVDIDTYLDNPLLLSKLFETDKKFKDNPLIQSIHETIHDMQTEGYVAQYDMDGLKIVPDAHGKWHDSFVQNIAELKTENGSPKIKNPQNLKEGSFIAMVVDVHGEKKYDYYKVVWVDIEWTMPSELRDEDGLKIKHRQLQLEVWWDGQGMYVPERQKRTEYKDYVKVWSMLKWPADSIEILTQGDIDARRSADYKGDWKIVTSYDKDDEYDSVDKLSSALWWSPAVGKLYTTKDVPWGADFYIKISDIDEDNQTIVIDGGWQKHDISFSEFYMLATDLKLEEIGKHDTDSEIQTLIQKIEGFDNIIVEDGVIKQKLKDKDGKDVSVPIHHFINADGEWMYFTKIGSMGAEVAFGKVRGEKSKKHKDGQDWDEVAGKINIGPFKSIKNNLSIVSILNELKENGYKPYINPEEKPQIDAEDHMPHTHGSFWWKIMNGTSVSDMMKAFDLYKHAWEHKLEKNSKFQAAKFADTYLKHLMPEGFAYQLRSEAYSAQNEAMEGILKMLENDMSGKEARLYIRKKILLNDDAKFEEVLAGLLYISKKTWQLYPEELSDLKKSEIWFHKLAVTQGYTSREARAELRANCIEKTDKAADGIDAVSEIDIIERQLKLYEGKWKRIPPNIAPKFPWAIVEWKKWNEEKWNMEVNQRTNIKQMNKYALSKLNVGEWYKVLGTIDRIHSKNGNAVELNAIPFTLLMSNLPEYMGSEFRKSLHSEWTGPRASHAFKFGNEMWLVNTYRGVVMLAAKEIERRHRGRWSSIKIVSELEKIEENRNHIGEEAHTKDTEDPQKKWINAIYEFWMKYWAELQPILQMSDTFIESQSKFWAKNSDEARLCKAYTDRWIGTMAMQNGWLITGGEIYKNSNVVEWNMVPDHTPFAFTNMVNASFTAIYKQNGMMWTNSSNGSAYGKIFKPWVLWHLYKLRNMSDSEVPPGMLKRDIQKMRFREYYAAIMYYLRTQGTNPPQIMLGGKIDGKEYATMDYIVDLQRFGFDIRPEDWRPSVSTIPAGAEFDPKTQQPNEFVIDTVDERRCDEMFENFINSVSVVRKNTVNNVNNTFDGWWNWWG